jgi:hypothetical protein
MSKAKKRAKGLFSNRFRLLQAAPTEEFGWPV